MNYMRAVLLAARATICTTYITMLNNPMFVALSREGRVAALKNYLIHGKDVDGEAAPISRTIADAFRTFFKENDGAIVVKALQATQHPVECTPEEQDKMLKSVAAFIPYAAHRNVFLTIHEVCMCMYACVCAGVHVYVYACASVVCECETASVYVYVYVHVHVY